MVKIIKTTPELNNINISNSNINTETYNQINNIENIDFMDVDSDYNSSTPSFYSNDKSINFSINNYDLEHLVELSNNTNNLSESIDVDLANTPFENREGYNKYLKDSVNEVGYGTREGVTVAALTYGIYTFYTGKKLMYHGGSIPQNVEQWPNTEGIVNDAFYMDCSNYAMWALYNGGYKIPSECVNSKNGEPATKLIEKWADINGYSKNLESAEGNIGDFITYQHTNGGKHIGIIVGTYDEGYYIAEARSEHWASQSGGAGGGYINKYTIDAICSGTNEDPHENAKLIDMKEYYNNQDNIRTNL